MIQILRTKSDKIEYHQVSKAYVYLTSPFNLYIVDLVEHGIAEEPLSPTSPDRGFRPRAGTGVEAKPEEKQNNSLPTIIKVVIIHISYYYLCKWYHDMSFNFERL